MKTIRLHKLTNNTYAINCGNLRLGTLTEVTVGDGFIYLGQPSECLAAEYFQHKATSMPNIQDLVFKHWSTALHSLVSDVQALAKGL